MKKTQHNPDASTDQKPVEFEPQPQESDSDLIDKIGEAVKQKEEFWTCRFRFDVPSHSPDGSLSDFPMGECNCTERKKKKFSKSAQGWTEPARCNSKGELL